ncbi:Acyl-coenzyme A synthetase ACSM5, mitochondrial [Pseudocercospora fuligena]|uniref:medium-chain acyl-CoA ligase n=1 Tax=Pseudocercospora fuligena TaxID=685502 RepID=A0A8H6RUB5_9PEZI|nr:Acyl-coenzyme A synthetase ACSM5, mitochondrial [Pseudocercospora fuligena]
MAHYFEPQLKRPKEFNFATDVVDYWAKNPSKGCAMHWISQDRKKERQLSFEHFSRQSHRLAVLFREKLGVQKGEKMLIIMPRLPEWWEIATAGIRSGIVICPATTLLVDKDIEYRANRSKASVFLGDSVAVQKMLKVRKNCPSIKHIFQLDGNSSGDVVLLSEALKSVPQDAKYSGSKPAIKDPSMIYFTSGTTGPPKMVQHNQISYPLAHTITGKYFHRLEPGQLNWVLTEQGWAKAGWAFLGTWNCGAGIFIHDDRGAFNPKATLDILNSYPITTFCAPPTVYRQLVLEETRKYLQQHPPKALKHCTGAGEPLNPEVIRLWLETTGMEICDGFGQSETILLCGNFKGNAIRPGSMGKPSPGTPLFVVGDDGKEAVADVEGDIAVKVDLTEQSNFFGVFDGYLDEGKLDRKLIECPEQGQAWYSTGDRAVRDKDGYFWFVGRNDDVINSAGYRIGPFEVESTLKQHPAVVESAVVSSPDKSRGEVVKAFIVLTAEFTKKDKDSLIKELQDFCKENAAPYKYPRKVQFVDPSFLPKTISGKIQRKKLKQMEWSRDGAKL